MCPVMGKFQNTTCETGACENRKPQKNNKKNPKKNNKQLVASWSFAEYKMKLLIADNLLKKVLSKFLSKDTTSKADLSPRTFFQVMGEYLQNLRFNMQLFSHQLKIESVFSLDLVDAFVVLLERTVNYRQPLSRSSLWSHCVEINNSPMCAAGTGRHQHRRLDEVRQNLTHLPHSFSPPSLLPCASHSLETYLKITNELTGYVSLSH